MAWLCMAALVTAILAWLHIFFAASWIGGAALFNLGIGPSLAKLSPSAGGEFFVKVTPKIINFFRIVSGLTVLFGFLLLYSFTNGNLELASPSNYWGLKIIGGALFGFIAFLLVQLEVVPTSHKALKELSQTTLHGSQQPSDRFLRLVKRSSYGAALVFVLLLVTIVFMIGAAFY